MSDPSEIRTRRNRFSAYRADHVFYFILVLLLTVFMPATYAADSKHGGTLICALEGEENNLNPHIGATSAVNALAGNIFNLLVNIDLEQRIVPGLAEKWEVSKDGLSYTFHLVKNAKWHDGKPFTSADVVYTLKNIYPESPRLGAWWKPDLNVSVEAPDNYTVVMKLKQPFAPFLTLLGFPVGGPFMMPKHLYEGTDLKKNPYNTKPIGTGPFMFKEWVKASHIELIRNPDYFAKGKENLPYIDRIVFRNMPDPAGRLIALKKGEVDFIGSGMVPNEEIADLRKDSKITIDSRGADGVTTKFLFFNVRNLPLSNKLVRQAIARGIDKGQINNLVLAGQGRPAKSINSSVIPWAYNTKVPEYAYDVQKANAMLDKAGYPRGTNGIRFKLRIHCISGRSVDVLTSEVIRDKLRVIGIDAEVISLDMAAFLDAVDYRWDFDLAVHQRSIGVDPMVGITRFIHGDQIKKLNAVNVMGYNNPEVNKLLDIEFKQINKKDRAATWFRIQDIVMEELPLVPLYEVPVLNVYRSVWADLVTTIYASGQSRERAYMKK